MTYYALILGTNGNGIGVHSYAEEPATYPANEAVCTEAQANQPMLWQLVSGALVQSLSATQAAQTALVEQSYATYQFNGFSSSALGSAYTYPSHAVAQTQLIALLTQAHSHMLAPAWAASEVVAVGEWCEVPGVGLFQCTAGGTTGTAAPTWPTVQGDTVVDNTVTWKLYDVWTGLFWCTSSAGVTARVAHTRNQMLQVGLDGAQYVQAGSERLATAFANIAAATTVAAVQAVTF
jgi:hypothetical protein